jgi:hypothetical protein
MSCKVSIQPLPLDPASSAGLTAGLRKKFLEQEAPRSDYVAHLKREEAVPLTLDSVVDSVVEPGPDIQWMPSHKTFQARVAALDALHLERPKRVPEEFPSKVIEPWVWSGEDFEGEDEYVIQLGEDDVNEIEDALAHFKLVRPGLDPGDVSVKTFPLPELAERLEEIAYDLHCGIGFAVLRGLEPRRYTALDNILIYLGVTSYIAPLRGVQDSSGNMLSQFSGRK